MISGSARETSTHNPPRRLQISTACAVVVGLLVYLAGPGLADMASVAVVGLVAAAAVSAPAALLAGHASLIVLLLSEIPAHSDGRATTVAALAILGVSALGAATHHAAISVIGDIRARLLRDPATGLPGGVALTETFARESWSPRCPRTLLVVDVPDLDEAGLAVTRVQWRELVAALADRLRLEPAVVSAYRVGGGRFVARVDGRLADKDVLKLRASLARPWRSGSGESAPFALRVHIGWAVYPDDGGDGETLLRAATAALRSAAGDPERTARAGPAGSEDLRVGGLLGEALQAGNIRPFMQARWDIGANAPCGAEILLRWPDAPNGMGPGVFVPAAEKFAMTGELLQVAIRGAARAAAVSPGRIAINVSGHDLREPAFASRFLGAITRADVSPDRVEVEVTETALKNAEGGDTLEQLRRVREAGVLVALDDFGVGESNLTHLSSWPVDIIKIDRAFVRGVPGDRRAEAVIHGVLAMARHLGAQVVAEGVETFEQEEWLSAVGVGYAQGFRYHRPEAVPDAAPDVQDGGAGLRALSPCA